MVTRVLVTGAGGQLGHDVVEYATRSTGNDVIGLTHRELDVADRHQVRSVVPDLRPDVIVHAAAWTDVDGCEMDPDRAFAVNALGTRHLAEVARLLGAHLAFVSTDYVFDGEATRAYAEWDVPRPLGVYGASKLAGERELDPSFTIVRTSWLSGVAGRNIVSTVLGLARQSDRILRFVDDQKGCPTFTEDLAPALWRLALDRRPGIFHVTNQGDTTWYGFVKAILEEAGHSPDRVQPIATSELDPPRPAPRPTNSVLDNAALRLGGEPLLPHWRDGLARLVRACHRSEQAE